MFLGVQSVWEEGQLRPLKRWVQKLDRAWFLRVVVLFNFCLLMGSSLVPARVEIPIMEHLYKNPVTDVYSVDLDPYEMFGLRVHWYRPKSLRTHRMVEPKELEALIHEGPITLFHASRVTPSLPEDLMEYDCEIQYQSLPEWADHPRLEPLWEATFLRVVQLVHCQLGEQGNP